MECSEDAIRIEWIHVENNGCFYQQLENQQSFGELQRKHAQEIWEKLKNTTLLNMYNPIQY